MSIGEVPEDLWLRHQDIAARTPDKPAIIDESGASLTHHELGRGARSLADGLHRLGLRRGDVMGVFLPNRSSWIITALATARLGVGVVGLNTRFRSAELDHLLPLADIDTVLVPDRFLGVEPSELFAGLADAPRLIVDGALDGFADDAVGFADLLGSALATSHSPTTGPVDPPLIGFTTSGTTGFPKIALHHAAGTTSHIDAIIDAGLVDQATVALVGLPLCGTFGYMSALPVIIAGGTVVLQEVWAPERTAELIAEHRVSTINGADSMLLDLISHARDDQLRSWRSGGFANFTNAGAALAREAETISAGQLRLTGLYGSSEGFALMSGWELTAAVADRSRSGGRLISETMRVRCCDPETGRELGHDEPGELQFRGPNLIEGYLGNPEATAAAFTGDGWYRSGDLGHTIDERTFVFLARLGDSLRLRGFLCDPAEIERHLEAHPGVTTAQVVGVERDGDVAVAFVTAGSSDPTEDELIAHCRAGLANFKCPARVIVVDAFPVTEGPNGTKIRKTDLRDRASALLQADSGP